MRRYARSMIVIAPHISLLRWYFDVDIIQGLWVWLQRSALSQAFLESKPSSFFQRVFHCEIPR
jgi:hypothetical protein